MTMPIGAMQRGTQNLCKQEIPSQTCPPATPKQQQTNTIGLGIVIILLFIFIKIFKKL